MGAPVMLLGNATSLDSPKARPHAVAPCHCIRLPVLPLPRRHLRRRQRPRHPAVLSRRDQIAVSVAVCGTSLPPSLPLRRMTSCAAALFAASASALLRQGPHKGRHRCHRLPVPTVPPPAHPPLFSWEAVYRVIPDEQPLIEATLRALCDDEACSLVVTTGGTGPAPRDVTPEATETVRGWGGAGVWVPTC